jgi:hypothetical protein
MKVHVVRVVAGLLAVGYLELAFVSAWASLYLLATLDGMANQVEIQGINYRLPWAPILAVAFLTVAGVLLVVVNHRESRPSEARKPDSAT